MAPAGLGRFVELMREEPAMKDAPDATVLSVWKAGLT